MHFKYRRMIASLQLHLGASKESRLFANTRECRLVLAQKRGKRRLESSATRGGQSCHYGCKNRALVCVGYMRVNGRKGNRDDAAVPNSPPTLNSTSLSILLNLADKAMRNVGSCI